MTQWKTQQFLLPDLRIIITRTKVRLCRSRVKERTSRWWGLPMTETPTGCSAHIMQSSCEVWTCHISCDHHVNSVGIKWRLEKHIVDASQVEFSHQSPEEDNSPARCHWIHSGDYLACISLSPTLFLSLLLFNQDKCFNKVLVLSWYLASMITLLMILGIMTISHTKLYMKGLSSFV